MRTPALRHFFVFGMMALSAACNSPTAPSRNLQSPQVAVTIAAPPVTAPAPAPAPPAALYGWWTGASTVEDTRGVLPSCVPDFWQPGGVDQVMAGISQTTPGTTVELALATQRSGESCRLTVTVLPDGRLTGQTAEGDDFFGQQVDTCDFRLPTTNWGCAGSAPEVWVHSMSVSASFSDDPQEHIQGVLSVTYDFRSDSESPYRSVAIVRHIELSKQHD